MQLQARLYYRNLEYNIRKDDFFKDFKKGILTPYDFAEHPDWIEFISPDHFKYIFKTFTN